jgi:hypothetical protein
VDVYFFIPWFGHRSTRTLLTIGFVWLILSVLSEFAMGIFLFHFPLSRMFEDYNVPKGGLFPLALVSPLLAARLRHL